MAADLNPPLGTTTPEIFLDNVKRADRLVNGPAETVNDRAGEPLDTWRQMMAKNDEVRQNIIPLSKQYVTLDAAQADIANIPVGATTYYRSPDDSALAIEVINNGGTLETTGRKMPSQRSVDEVSDFSKMAASSLNKGECVTFGDVTTGAVTAEYITVDGVKTSSATRKLMALVMAPGDTAFYKAKHASKMTASEADIPNALFVADAGSITVIAPAPLALNVTSYTDGR
ncbi:SGNH/GDSL hydrolase family protein, partial [Klebsiella michiganensis]|nr:SGNH/GDSL hydrolase family protein [Klebsiella michiganensis]